MRTLLALLSLSFVPLCTQICVAQDSTRLMEFNFYSDNDKTLIYFDDFNELNPAWGYSSIEEFHQQDSDSIPLNIGSRKDKRRERKLAKEEDVCTVKDGYYYYHDKEGTTAMPLVQEIDFNKNFEIEIKAMVKGGVFKNTFGIIYWGRVGETPITGEYLYYRNYRECSLFYCDGKDENKPCKPGDNFFEALYAKSPYIFNTYTIRKIDNTYYIFGNKNFIRKAQYIPLSGKVIGLGGGKKSKVQVDYIKISYLPDPQ